MCLKENKCSINIWLLADEAEQNKTMIFITPKNILYGQKSLYLCYHQILNLTISCFQLHFDPTKSSIKYDG